MSYVKLYYHIVFGTKERAPMIRKEIRTDLHSYLGGIVRNLRGIPIEINGVEDHVHVLACIPPTIAISAFMSKFKASSSSWGSRRTNGRFGWGERYAAFTVGEPEVEVVRAYIRNQEEHHKTISYRDELISLLRAHGIDFDERDL